VQLMIIIGYSGQLRSAVINNDLNSDYIK